jgi:hypothetical protein
MFIQQEELISLTIAVDCPFGKVAWTLRATVHRPGAFTPKYQHSINITVVRNPLDEDDEEADGVTIERFV